MVLMREIGEKGIAGPHTKCKFGVVEESGEKESPGLTPCTSMVVVLREIGERGIAVPHTE